MADTSLDLPAAPPRILLATDLSARSDRALDRAADLAREWNAELVALNVLDPAASPDRLRAWVGSREDGEAYAMHIAHRQLTRDLRGAAVKTSIVVSAAADTVAAIIEAAREIKARLVVTGVARSEALGRFLLGSTVAELARKSPQPLLVVRERPLGPYARLVLATDFSPESQHALAVLARLFPGREIVVYHAVTVPLRMDASDEDLRHLDTTPAREQAEALVAATDLPAGTVTRIVIEHGNVEGVLARYVREQDCDLVAIGTRSQGVLERLLGSTAAELMQWIPCDMLVVRQAD